MHHTVQIYHVALNLPALHPPSCFHLLFVITPVLVWYYVSNT